MESLAQNLTRSPPDRDGSNGFSAAAEDTVLTQDITDALGMTTNTDPGFIGMGLVVELAHYSGVGSRRVSERTSGPTS